MSVDILQKKFLVLFEGIGIFLPHWLTQSLPPSRPKIEPMVAASSQGGAGTRDGGEEAVDGGGALTHGGSGLGGGAEEGDCCGSSNPVTVKEVSPSKAAAATVARVWKEQPSQSNLWTTGLGGV